MAARRVRFAMLFKRPTAYFVVVVVGVVVDDIVVGFTSKVIQR